MIIQVYGSHEVLDIGCGLLTIIEVYFCLILDNFGKIISNQPYEGKIIIIIIIIMYCFLKKQPQWVGNFDFHSDLVIVPEK